MTQGHPTDFMWSTGNKNQSSRLQSATLLLYHAGSLRIVSSEEILGEADVYSLNLAHFASLYFFPVVFACLNMLNTALQKKSSTVPSSITSCSSDKKNIKQQ